MLGKIIFWVLFIIVILVLIYMASNALDNMNVLYANLSKSWDRLKELMNLHFRLVVKEIDSDNQDLINILNRQSKIVKDEDFINAYYDLEKIILSCNFSDELRNELLNNSNEIEKNRKDYNDDALKMNNYVNSFPTNFLALVKRYKKWIYFREK